MGLDFFKQYGGRRLGHYNRMLETGLRADGARLAQGDRADVETQVARFNSELSRRG